MSGLYGNGIALTEKVLDYLWGRQTITINNIANVDTPGFKSQYLSFEEKLGQRIHSASNRIKPSEEVNQAIRRTTATVGYAPGESNRLDGNSVDMDQEQVELVRTAYEYQHMISSVSNDISRLRNAAKSF